MLLTGMRTPRGHYGIHLGNYFGIIPLLARSEKDVFFFAADLHTITTEKINRQDSLNLIKFCIAALKEYKINYYIQSDFPQISYLSWFLTSVTPTNNLFRMIQFKEKSKTNINAGILYYPILMSADILIHCDLKNNVEVPVGSDQKQHMEFARDLAHIFNKNYGDLFSLPIMQVKQENKIQDLKNPMIKMSKTNPKGAIFINDSNEEIKNKINKAITDSLVMPEINELTSRESIKNLLNLYALSSNITIEEATKLFQNQQISDFKMELIEKLITFISPIRKKYNDISNWEVEELLNESRPKLNSIFDKQVLKMKEMVLKK